MPREGRGGGGREAGSDVAPRRARTFPWRCSRRLSAPRSPASSSYGPTSTRSLLARGAALMAGAGLLIWSVEGGGAPSPGEGPPGGAKVGGLRADYCRRAGRQRPARIGAPRPRRARRRVLPALAAKSPEPLLLPAEFRSASGHLSGAPGRERGEGGPFGGADGPCRARRPRRRPPSAPAPGPLAAYCRADSVSFSCKDRWGTRPSPPRRRWWAAGAGRRTAGAAGRAGPPPSPPRPPRLSSWNGACARRAVGSGGGEGGREGEMLCLASPSLRRSSPR